MDAKELSHHVEWPNAFLNLLKESWAWVTPQDIKTVQEAVKYDIARKMQYSEQGLYVAIEIFQRLRGDDDGHKDSWVHFLFKNQKLLDEFIKIFSEIIEKKKDVNILPFRKK